MRTPAAAALLCMALPGVASGQEATGRAVETPPPKLVVTRTSEAEDCPDDAALAATLEKLVARRPAVDLGPGPGEGFDVYLGKEAGRFVAIVRPRGEVSAERRLSDPGPTCDGLAEALTLTLAVLLDREQPRTAEGPGPGNEPAAPPPPRAPDRRPPQPRAPSREASMSADAGVMATFGMIDALSPAFFGELELEPIHRVAFAGGVLVLPAQSQSTDGPGHVDVSVLAGSLRGCWYPIGRPVRVGACAIAAAGGLTAEGQDFDEQGRATSFWFDLGAAALVRGHLLGPFGWSARAAVWGQLRNETVKVCFEPDGAPSGDCQGQSGARVETYYETAPVAASIGAGLYATIF